MAFYRVRKKERAQAARLGELGSAKQPEVRQGEVAKCLARLLASSATSEATLPSGESLMDQDLAILDCLTNYQEGGLGM